MNKALQLLGFSRIVGFLFWDELSMQFQLVVNNVVFFHLIVVTTTSNGCHELTVFFYIVGVFVDRKV